MAGVAAPERARSSKEDATGSSNVNVLPRPGSLSAQILPPCASTTERAIASPIPVADGEPMFGRWQRLILFEMDEPKDRQVVFHVFGG